MATDPEPMSPEDITEDIGEEDPNVVLLSEIKSSADQIAALATTHLNRLNDRQYDPEKGNSFMELKNRMFLGYLMDLLHLIRMKVSGEKIEGSRVVVRLVEARTVLERMRPIEHKLKYTFDKLIKASKEGAVDPNDPMGFKPKLSSIIDSKDDAVDDEEDDEMDGEESEDEDDSEKAAKTKSDVYVPPKVAQMRFDEEEDRRAKALERAKKRALNSSIITELRREYDDAPEEVSHSSHSSHQNRVQRFLKEKTAYEEDYMTRTNLTKKERNESKRLQTMTSLSSDLTRFEDISALDVDNADDFQLPNKKKRGSKQKQFKRKKFTKLRK